MPVDDRTATVPMLSASRQAIETRIDLTPYEILRERERQNLSHKPSWWRYRVVYQLLV